MAYTIKLKTTREGERPALKTVRQKLPNVHVVAKFLAARAAVRDDYTVKMKLDRANPAEFQAENGESYLVFSDKKLTSTFTESDDYDYAN